MTGLEGLIVGVMVAFQVPLLVWIGWNVATIKARQEARRGQPR